MGVMNKDQAEALRMLDASLNLNDEHKLREAVVLARRTERDTKLDELYNRALDRLKELKHLPSGWQVGELIGDDADGKMLSKPDITGATKNLFQQLFDVTKSQILTRDRAGAVPRGYQVEQVISVQNADSWSSYSDMLTKVTTDCSRVPSSAPIKDWTSYNGQINTFALSQTILNKCNLPPLTANANEFLLFHGTKADAASLIAENHFDMAYACKDGLFGAGLYFAENSSKSDEYVKPSKEGLFPIILCRVALGRINYCAEKDPVAHPGRTALQDSCSTGGYHSVLGDRKKVRGTFREFIVYDHFQVYPQFIVWYKRLG